jgi:hypothetical protein
VQIFAKRRTLAVQSFILKLINNNCPDLRSRLDGPRSEGRVPLTVVVLVVPMEKKRPAVGQVFAAVSKEFSTNGTALITSRPRDLEEVALGFRWEGEMVWILATAKHLSPMGAGFYQLGFRMTEVLYVADYPELRSLSF